MSHTRVDRAILKEVVLGYVRNFLSSTPYYVSLSIQQILGIIARGINNRLATRGQVSGVFYELIDSGNVPELKGIRDQEARGKRKTRRESRKRWRTVCGKERLEGDILTLNLALENAGMSKNVL